jgi:hypothetical protein
MATEYDFGGAERESLFSAGSACRYRQRTLLAADKTLAFMRYVRKAMGYLFSKQPDVSSLDLAFLADLAVD